MGEKLAESSTRQKQVVEARSGKPEKQKDTLNLR
jgi:hypothetical protein